MIDVNRSQIYRTKRKALEMIQGNHKEQYNMLWDYCEMVRRSNPNSVLLLKVERPSLEILPVFQRLFVCLSAIRDGFVAGCRPMIGLDGCHLKGPYGGQMLHAVGKDGNEGMYPIAFAVVEAETKDSWTWFLTHLTEAIGTSSDRGWTFISDRQKVCNFHFTYTFSIDVYNIVPYN